MRQKPLRYPGAQPFETKQKGLFFGREQTAQEFYRLIKLERVVVLHSKSGLGKSSLLNAAIIPKIIEDDKYIPVRIRFNAWVDGVENQWPLQMTSEVVRGGVKSASTFLDKLIPDENTLWHDIKEHQIKSNNKKNIILLFDQFEELFTYPKEAINAFGKQLVEALSVTLPQRYWNRLEAMDDSELDDNQLQILQQAPQLKIVLAIRSDKMSLLDNLSDHLPSILKICYELKPLNIQQAKEAILLPAKAAGVFASDPFDYETSALDNILDFLVQDKKDGIESTQLQIVCTAMEKKAMANALALIQLSDTKNLGDLIKKYYDEKIALLDTPEQQIAARKLIEEELIFESEERRISLYEGQILSAGVTAESLRILVDSHLLRSESSPQGGFTYELSHDTLVVPVLKAKRNRMAILERESREQERHARVQELKEARQKVAEEKHRTEEQANLRAIAEKGELRARQRTRFASVVSILALILAGLSLSFWNSAKDANKETKAALNLAKEQKQFAMHNDSIAQKQRIKAEEQTQLALSTLEQLTISKSISNKRALEAEKNLKESHHNTAHFLVSETERALKNEDIRLALLLNKKALEKNNKNIKAKYLSKILPFYSSKYFLDAQSHKLNKDSSFIAIKSKSEDDGYTLEVLSLKENRSPQIFKNCGTYNYSNNGDYLSVWTKGKNSNYTVLNILSLNKKSPTITIKNCKKESDTFSNDNKYLTVWTKEEGEETDKDHLTLKILELDKPEAIRSFHNTIHRSGRFSSDNKYLTFLTEKKEDGLATLNVLTLNDSSSPRTFKHCDSDSYPKLNKQSNLQQKNDSPEFHTVKKSDSVWGLSRKYGLTQDELMEINNLANSIIHPNQQLRLRYPIVDNFSGNSKGGKTKYLSFWTRTIGDSTRHLNVLELDKKIQPRVFEDVSTLHSRYSNDNKYLAYWTKGESGEFTKLNLLNLHETTPAQTFENADKLNFRFTNDSKRFIFWTSLEDCNNLQILSLDGKSPDLFYKNSKPLIDRFSTNDQFFLFWTDDGDHKHSKLHTHTNLNVLDLSGKNPLRTYDDSYNFLFNFSSDNKYLTFWTKDEHTLNVLELNKNKLPYIFEGTREFLYSHNGKYLSFLQNGEGKNKDVLQVLDLSNNNLTSHKSGDVQRLNYSYDSEYLSYFTKDAEGNFSTLNLKGLSDPSYSRSFENSYAYFYTPNKKYLAFRSDDDPGNHSTLNVIELGKHHAAKKFEHCYRNYFSRDDKYLSYVEKRPGEKISKFKVIDMQTGNEEEEIYHRYTVKSIHYLGRNIFMTVSKHSDTKGIIYKMVEPSVEEKTYAYCMGLYPSLSLEEKKRYGIAQ